ncbi:MAG: PilZ domain-containing protein [Kofleriaceae bacterium]
MTPIELTTAIPAPTHRRASARASARGLARVECWDRVGGYRVGDISFGGIRLIGRPGQLEVEVGDRVRIMVAARADGRAFDLDVWAEVVRVGDNDLGVAWNLTNPVDAEQIAYWVASAASDYDEYSIS